MFLYKKFSYPFFCKSCLTLYIIVYSCIYCDNNYEIWYGGANGNSYLKFSKESS